MDYLLAFCIYVLHTSDESEPTFWQAELSWAEIFYAKASQAKSSFFALKTSFVDSQMDITVTIIWFTLNHFNVS